MLPIDLSFCRVAGDLHLPPLGVGTGTSRWSSSPSQPDDATLLAGLRRAVEDGVGFIDTADSQRQGHAERLVGKILKESRGHSVQVSSTVGRVLGSAPHPYAGPRVRHQLEQTLENLYLPELAVYILESYDFGNGDRYLGPVIDQMRALRDVGHIRAIGLRGPGERASVRSRGRFLELFEQVRPDVVWTQASGLYPLPDLGGGEDLGSFATRHRVGLLIASPLAHGVLAGRPLRGEAPQAGGVVEHSTEIARGLAALRDRFGPSVDSLLRVALRYLLRRAQNVVVVVGVGDARQVASYFSCLGRPLSTADLQMIEEVFCAMRTAINPLCNGMAGLTADPTSERHTVAEVARSSLT
ncbi:Predicted oxidoreductase [Streptomyces sp. MnatMP-M77]|uniref:aldo/keto reductase n=1 Tax=unclassified Streptomyces TaxID=2593676 RepID=UPI000804CA5A|nr:aldo/keto reductase [Streptomyces sp. MnatMP-M77]MYT82372.1 aldo/keto reductase [Streptomyces sp. SID8364]SBU96371.1 Predicted oxidoreductase [Streptomyces sp. MnatMP-M77]